MTDRTTHQAPGFDYARYLAAKKSVDDRAIDRRVLADVGRLLPGRPPRVLEIGAGLGTMVARLLEWQVLRAGEYTLLDVDGGLLRASRAWLGEWAAARALPVEQLPDGLRVAGLRVRLVEAELAGYLEGGHGAPADLLVASAFLDVVDVPTVLPRLLRLLVPGGVYWFPVTFDGESVFQPDHPADDAVLGAYHATMDHRVRHGRPAGESRAGRHLFGALRAAGAPPLSAGSSDWVVHAGPDGYPGDEAHFVSCILRTVEDALPGHPGVAGWLAARRRQLTSGELVYIAHQLDVAGRWPG
jgi:SAM-dependent methyltransferase